MIYLDYAASARIYPAAAREMMNVELDYYGNPSSLHSAGYRCKEKLEDARKRIADLVKCEPNQIYFTSGASEGNSWVIDSLVSYCAAKGKRHIIVSPYEHPSIMNKLKQYNDLNIEYVNVMSNGQVDIDDLRNKITDQTAFICVMGVNNEVGAYNNPKALKYYAPEDTIVFSDFTQLLPHHFNINCALTDVDIFTCSAHKFGGPRGVGFVYCKDKSYLEPLITGGKQERYLRGGTENLAGICGMATALEQHFKLGFEKGNQDYLNQMYALMLRELQYIDGIQFNSNMLNSLPFGIINFYIKGISGEQIVSMLNQNKIFCSMSSACSSGENEPSRTLLAMGKDEWVARNSIRFSMGEICESNVRKVINMLYVILDFLRN